MDKKRLFKALASLRAVLLYVVTIFANTTGAGADPHFGDENCPAERTSIVASETLDVGETEFDPSDPKSVMPGAYQLTFKGRTPKVEIETSYGMPVF